MKRLIFMLLTGLLLSQAKAQSKTETIVIRTSIYCDHCAACETCQPRIEEELYNEKGVTDAALNEKESTITVKYNPKRTTPEAIRLAISKLGYDADDIAADKDAVRKLDDCCKKK
jgi:mercuric ion binding protein